MRASTAEATRKEASSAVVRTAISPPIFISERMRARSGALPARGAPLHPHERRAHADLGDDGAPRRAGEAPAEAVDEQQLEHDVDRVRGDEDVQRRAQVRDPAQEALAGAREHEERRAERGDPQVRRRLVEDLALAAHQRRDRAGERGGRQQQHEPDPGAEPQRLRAEPRRLLLLPGAVQPRDARGRAVGEEVEDREGGGQRGRRDRQRRRAGSCRGGRRSPCRRARRAARRPARRARARRAGGSRGRRVSCARGAQDEAPPLPPSRRRPGRLSRGGHRPGARAAALRAAHPPRVGAAGRGALGPLPARAARPAAARRLRGPPAPPLLARLDGRGDRRLLPRGVRAAAAGRRPRRRRADPAARGPDRASSRRGGS